MVNKRSQQDEGEDNQEVCIEPEEFHFLERHDDNMGVLLKTVSFHTYLSYLTRVLVR